MSSVDINLWDLLQGAATRYPHKTAIKQAEQSYSYAALKDRVGSLAGFLRGQGLQPGDQLAVLSPNSIAYVETIFADAKLGIVTELLNWRLAPARLCELLEASAAKYLFLSAKCASVYAYLRANLKRELVFVCMDGTLDGAISSEALYAPLPDDELLPGPSGAAPAILIYSSGTTNVPKAMLHSVKNLVTKAFIATMTGNWSADEVYLLTSPLFHSSCTGLFTCMLAGATCVLGETTIESMMRAITVDRATRVGVVPSVFNRILDYVEAHPEADCSSISHIEYGAAPMSAEQISRSMKYFRCGFYQYYGTTETAATITALLPAHHQDSSKLKSAGIPVIGTQIKIIDDSGVTRAPYERGEIAVRHPCTITEYLNAPAQSAAAFQGEWYLTGDIGYLDEEGFLYLVDRKNDLIITGGENVYPKEIASCIAELEGVKDVAVTGVPDSNFGETIMAAVVQYPGAQLTETEIVEHCRHQMASYKKPRHVYFVDELPLNATGKVDKNAVKAIHFRHINLEENK